VDAATGARLEARVHALASTGQFRAPPDAIRKVGGGPPFFYAEGGLELDLPAGQADLLVERGTEYLPLQRVVEVPRTGEVVVELPLARWTNLPARGWHAGNTHIHYDEKEQRPDERLRLDPRVEDLSVAAVSVLQRRELAYATNRYPVGFFRGASTSSYAVDVGEETRHNSQPWEIGYGHVMLLGLQQLVEPMSRGALVSDDDPDYPPLIDACDEAHRQGGIAIWCHSGRGMEAPVAAALGKLDAFNLFDPFWQDPEWDVWYALLNCGLRLPASTGSDWFICSSNRVYVRTGAGTEAADEDHEHAGVGAAEAAEAADGGPRHTSHDVHPAPGPTSASAFDPADHYRRWLDGLRAGRSFITNGPALSLAVEGREPGQPGQDLAGSAGRAELSVEVRWQAAQPLHRVELVRNGRVVARHAPAEGEPEGTVRWRLPQGGAGEWVAARCFGRGRTSYGHFLWAHTSPIYLGPPPDPGVPVRPATPEGRESARFFVAEIDRALSWIGNKGRYREPAHRDRLIGLFGQARELYRTIAG
jgi:hypothetical protein